MLCALGARVKLVSSSGERVIPLTELYFNDGVNYLTRQPGEILTEILLPADSDADNCRTSFMKLRRRGSIDFGVLSVAVAIWLDDKDVVKKASMYLGNVDSMPLKVDEIEELLVGNKLTVDLVDQVAHHAQKIAQPMDNTDFVASWRGKMAERYAVAALGEIAGLPVRKPLPRHGLTVV
jgi:4-hydroxybenzoyl-CoA reductase subunit beta